MKKIALDIDGVIFDSENLFRVYSEIYDVDVFKSDNIIDNSEKLFQKRYDWTEEEKEKFYNKYIYEIIDNSNIVPGADIVLNKLKDKFEFIIVTSRPDPQIDGINKWLDKMNFNFKIYNNEQYKVDRLLSEKVDYVIDDCIDICSNAAENGIIALYFKNNACNKLYKENVINVNNWGEIYKYLILNKD